MGSASEWMARLAPAAIVLKAIVVSVVGIAALMAFIMVRRWFRARYFARRERKTFEIRQHWNQVVSGEISPDTWRFDRLACEVVEFILLDKIEVSSEQDLPPLLECMRRSGLIDRRIEQARDSEGWQRWRALVALGRTRAPEAVPALADALDSPDMETRIAAVRGIGKLAFADAAVPLLDRLCDERLVVPSPVIRNALVNCCADNPEILLHYLSHAWGTRREILARVLAEIANPAMGDELVVLAQDDSAEVRAAAARALSRAPAHVAVPPLAELAADPEWFVRLRAVVALGSFAGSDANAVLVRALGDRNRHVRQRAAWALMKSPETMLRTLRKVVDGGDNYGLQAIVTELERSGRYAEALDQALRQAGRDTGRVVARLQAAHARLGLEQKADKKWEEVGAR